MTTAASVFRRVLFASFIAFAAFIPFSIAGMNIAFGFGVLSWIGWWTTRERTPRVEPRRFDPLVLASILLALSLIPSVLMSENSARAIKDASSCWQLLILFWAAYNVIEVRAQQPAFWTLLATSCLACLLVVVQGTGGFQLGNFEIPSRYRPGGTLYNMTFAGIVYQLIVLNCAMIFAREMSPRRRVVLAAVVALQTTAIMVTMTRGAWLALIAGIVVLCLMLKNRVAIAAAAALVLGIAALSLFGHQGRSIPELARSGLDKDASTRLVLWDIAWDLFKQHPLAGVGMGDYTIEADKLLAGRRVTTTVDTHNVYLQVLATRGLIGFVPFVAFWVVFLRQLRRIRRASERGSLAHQFAVGAIAATVALLVGALTELNIDDSEVFMAFLFIAGLALAPRRRN